MVTIGRMSKRFGERLQTAIEKAGMTKYRLAKETGISQVQIGRLVSGERDATSEAVEKIAPVLGISTDEMQAWADADRLGDVGLERIRHYILQEPTINLNELTSSSETLMKEALEYVKKQATAYRKEHKVTSRKRTQEDTYREIDWLRDYLEQSVERYDPRLVKGMLWAYFDKWRKEGVSDEARAWNDARLLGSEGIERLKKHVIKPEPAQISEENIKAWAEQLQTLSPEDQRHLWQNAGPLVRMEAAGREVDRLVAEKRALVQGPKTPEAVKRAGEIDAMLLALKNLMDEEGAKLEAEKARRAEG